MIELKDGRKLDAKVFYVSETHVYAYVGGKTRKMSKKHSSIERIVLDEWTEDSIRVSSAHFYGEFLSEFAEKPPQITDIFKSQYIINIFLLYIGIPEENISDIDLDKKISENCMNEQRGTKYQEDLLIFSILYSKYGQNNILAALNQILKWNPQNGYPKTNQMVDALKRSNHLVTEDDVATFFDKFLIKVEDESKFLLSV